MNVGMSYVEYLNLIFLLPFQYKKIVPLHIDKYL